MLSAHTGRPMRTAACLTLAAFLGSSAVAQTGDARRRLYPTEDGFLEVDGRTGAVTECKRAPDGYRCARVTEGDVLLREEPGPQAEKPAAPRPAPRAAEPPGPSDGEIDRALGVMERFLRRFMDIVREGRSERT